MCSVIVLLRFITSSATLVQQYRSIGSMSRVCQAAVQCIPTHHLDGCPDICGMRGTVRARSALSRVKMAAYPASSRTTRSEAMVKNTENKNRLVAKRGGEVREIQTYGLPSFSVQHFENLIIKMNEIYQLLNFFSRRTNHKPRTDRAP